MPLALQEASKPESTILLGALVIRQLRARGQCSFFVNREGVIEIANPVELALDSQEEATAILHLAREHKYTDEQLIAYMRGREDRALFHPSGEDTKP